MGSPYANLDTSGSSAKSPYANLTPGGPSGGGGSGGLLGSALHAVGHTVGSAAHWTASKADLMSHDIAGIGGGLYGLGKQVVAPGNGGSWGHVGDEYKALFTGHPGRMFSLAQETPAGRGDTAAISALTKGQYEQAKGVVEHPARDPFLTALNLFAVGSLGAGAAARLGSAARAGDVADAVKSLARQPAVKTRTLNVPKLVAPEGEGPANLTHEPVHLQASTNAAVRAAQGVHDKLVQRSLDKNVSTANPSRVAKYGAQRVAKTTGESARISQRANAVDANMLERSGSGRNAFDKGVSQKAGQLALFLRSANVTGEDAARFWKGQAAKGVNPADTGKLARLAQQVHDRGILHVGDDGNVRVNAEQFPKLGNADALTRENQATRAGIIGEHGLMSPEGLQSRLDLVGKRMAGGQYVKPTPGRNGVPSQGLIRARAYAARLGTLVDRAEQRVAKHGSVDELLGGGLYGGRENMIVRNLKAAHSAALDEVQRFEDAAARRAQPTGVVGGEEARPGQGYTPLKTSVKRQPQGASAASRTPVISKVRGFVGGKSATGEGVAKGLIPDNTTAGVADAARQALRYQNSVEHRGMVAKYGSDVRRTGDDVLVADPAAENHGEIASDVNQLLGREHSTLNTISEDEHVGLAKAIGRKVVDAIPGLEDNFATDRAAGLGTRAPAGYKWVPKQMLGDLVKETTPRWAATKAINDVNSAVTAATVYFKLSHIPQRLTTNAATNLLQGSLTPSSIRDAMVMRKSLSEREFNEAVAVTGAHGYEALPHEGTSRVSRVASKGANFYARKIDSPFRFLSLVYEAKKSGFDTPDKFRELLAHAKNPLHTPGKNAAETEQMDWVLRRANRASMMYDGLGANEKRILARGLWFYPWTKAAVRFSFHTMSEHPLKTAIGGNLGAQGRAQQQSILGDVPSYEYGLIPLGGGDNPLTTDLNMLSPFGTAANVAELAARPGGFFGNLNPVYGAVLTAGTGINQYGAKTNSPIGSALSELFAPTPEAQILSAYLHPPRPTQVFQKTPMSAFWRAVLGAETPRRVNVSALNSSAAREKSGR